MSYCRWDGKESDLYIIHHCDGYLTCYNDEFKTPLRSEMIQHCREHRNKNDRVPGYVFDQLAYEIEQYGDHI